MEKKQLKKQQTTIYVMVLSSFGLRSVRGHSKFEGISKSQSHQQYREPC
jgi:hypothetical protein